MATFARIFLRYLAGMLVTSGFLSKELGDMLAIDPDVLLMVQLGLAAICGLISEYWYYLAKKYGWAT